MKAKLLLWAKEHGEDFNLVLIRYLQERLLYRLSRSRHADAFDLRYMCRTFSFDGERLVGAVRATFERRGTPLPRAVPLALSPEFADDDLKRTQWTAFQKCVGEQRRPQALPLVVTDLRRSSSPCSMAAARAPPRGRVSWRPVVEMSSPRRDELEADIAREEERLSGLHAEAEATSARLAALREQLAAEPVASLATGPRPPPLPATSQPTTAVDPELGRAPLPAVYAPVGFVFDAASPAFLVIGEK